MLNKLTDAKSYEEFLIVCQGKGYTVSTICSKKGYFIKNNLDDRYDEIISWCDLFKKTYQRKEKVTPELAKEYLDKWGGSEAVRKLLDECGIVITRQALYAAVKRGGY